jgi:hypothetical protein
VAAVERWLSATGASGLPVWPTRAGKSLLISKISRLAVREGRPVLVASHVVELVAHDATACERALGANVVSAVFVCLGQCEIDRSIKSKASNRISENQLGLATDNEGSNRDLA